MHNSRVAKAAHFGTVEDSQAPMLVPSFQGERDLAHCVYAPDAANEGMGNFFDDMLDSLRKAAQTAGSAAGGSILGDIAQDPNVQAQAKKAGVEAAIDWLATDYRWVWVLGGTALAGVGTTVLITQLMKKRK